MANQVELGFVNLVQSGLGSPPMAPGGYMAELPKNLLGDGTNGTFTTAWTFTSLSKEPTYVLEGEDGFTAWELRINCHGFAPAGNVKSGSDSALALANAIITTLQGGWAGTLSDGTVVQGIHRMGEFVSGFSDIDRSYVITIEYLVEYNRP